MKKPVPRCARLPQARNEFELGMNGNSEVSLAQRPSNRSLQFELSLIYDWRFAELAVQLPSMMRISLSAAPFKSFAAD